jgi:hypothetical protein
MVSRISAKGNAVRLRLPKSTKLGGNAPGNHRIPHDGRNEVWVEFEVSRSLVARVRLTPFGGRIFGILPREIALDRPR